MRILHLSSLYPPGITGGAEKVAAMLAEGQAGQGHTVGAAYLSRESEPASIRNGVEVLPQKSRNLIWIDDVPSRSRPSKMANKLLQVVDLRASDDFGAAIRRFAPDVVHTHSMVELTPMIWREAKKAGATLVHTLHDYDLLCSRGTLFRDGRPCAARHTACRVLSEWKGAFHREIDAVAAVSQSVLDAHLDHGFFRRLPDTRRAVIWNGVKTSRSLSPRAGCTGPLTFGFLGRLVPEKGVGILIDACRGLPDDGWRLQIAGRALVGGEDFQARAAGLPIEFLGFGDPEDFLDSIDVLVVPSLWAEPFGLTVVEAYAAGVPVIGADSGAIGDLVGAVNPQWVVEAGNVEALTARMTEVIAAGRQALPPPQSFTRVLDAARPDRMISSYLNLYQAALETTRLLASA